MQQSYLLWIIPNTYINIQKSFNNIMILARMTEAFCILLPLEPSPPSFYPSAPCPSLVFSSNSYPTHRSTKIKTITTIHNNESIVIIYDWSCLRTYSIIYIIVILKVSNFSRDDMYMNMWNRLSCLWAILKEKKVTHINII